MTKTELALFIENAIKRSGEVRIKGQSEYTNSDNPFGNFNRLAEILNQRPVTIGLIYAMKHLDGIISFINGNIKQRDSITGRFDDLHNYLWLMEAMLIEEGKK